MPAKSHLTLEQKEKLQKALKREENGDIRERILILLLLNDGKTQQKIADFLGCSLNKVNYWCVHGDPDNLESLKDERMKGNHQKATKEYIEILLEVIEKEPKELGYEFGRWSVQRLAIYLEEQTGIKLSGSQVRRILEQKKYVYLWSKYSLDSKQDKTKRKAFKEKLAEYFKIEKENPERLQVWFWDETGFSLRVRRGKNWCRKGTRKKVRGDRRKGGRGKVLAKNLFQPTKRRRVNVMGALRYSDKKRFVDFLDKSNSKSFYEVLKIFYNELMNG